MINKMEQSKIIKDAQDLVAKYGSPLFVYDGNIICNKYDLLKKAFKHNDINIHYAMKALNNSNILRLLIQKGAGIDAVSINEVHLALRAGCAPNHIMFTPNCVAFTEIEEAVALGVQINIDSISILEQFGNKYGSSVPCCIRINPHLYAGGHHNISVGHIDSKFGISIYQMRHVHRVVAQFNIIVHGIHMHTGSDILDAQVFVSGAELLYEAAASFKDLSFVDFGSGFKVAYKEGDYSTDINLFAEALEVAHQNFCDTYGKKLTLCFEPGKFLVSEAGYLLVKATVVKQTTSTIFIGVNSGQNHIIRPMFYNAYHHVTNTSNLGGIKNRVYSVVGNICETDTLAADRVLAETQEGDVLAIHNAGAYCYTMSNNYNARARPAEVLLLNGTYHLIRKAESIEDLVRNEVMVDVGLG
jgi:diaminopimelate decarboxylase